ncbi:MAG TPA: hypothetical protein VNJ28_06260, partial [Candidatus Limnocylindrales bacterium]|nr:hypothetical protein [Candidatus Limnocylindrales bacterium]
REGIGRYAGRLETVPFPTEGSRRERVEAFLDALARAFERAIAAAPEQWWAVFFPIWPDLEPAGEAGEARPRRRAALGEPPIADARAGAPADGSAALAGDAPARAPAEAPAEAIR